MPPAVPRPEHAWPRSSTRVAGVIGSNAKWSLSPAIHNAAFADAGLDWVYVAFNVARGHSADALLGIRALGIVGLSVTMPHKQAVVGKLDQLTPVAQAIGAVNTITRDGDRLTGDNTDADGFVTGLRESLHIDLDDRSIVVIGAGGAARAVTWAASNEGASDLTVVARRLEAARELADWSRSVCNSDLRVTGCLQQSQESEAAIAGASLVVNATPAGKAGEPPPIGDSKFVAGQFVYDLVYRPAETPLTAAASAAGAIASTGLEMLVAQAALQFELWTGRAAPTAIMRSAARVALAESDAPK